MLKFNNKYTCLIRKIVKRLTYFFLIISISISCLSCGIPSIFYLDSQSYNISFSANSGIDDKTCEVGMSFSDTYQLSKCSNCPSVMLFYWIDTQNTVDQVKSNLLYEYRSKFKKTTYDGVALKIFPSDEDETVVPTVISTDEKKYNLYYPRLCNISSSSEVKLTPPTYYYSLPSGQTSLYFDIVQESDSTSTNFKKIYLVKNIGTPSEDKLELVRYNLDSFSEIPTKSEIDSVTYADYISVDSTYTEGDDLYVHFCVAFCTASGAFNNIFWSNLIIDPKLTFKIS